MNDLDILPTFVLKSHSVSERDYDKCAVRKLQSILVIWGLAGKSEAERHRWPLAMVMLFYQASLQLVQRWSVSAEQGEVMRELVAGHGLSRST